MQYYILFIYVLNAILLHFIYVLNAILYIFVYVLNVYQGVHIIINYDYYIFS